MEGTGTADPQWDLTPREMPDGLGGPILNVTVTLRSAGGADTDGEENVFAGLRLNGMLELPPDVVALLFGEKSEDQGDVSGRAPLEAADVEDLAECHGAAPCAPAGIGVPARSQDAIAHEDGTVRHASSGPHARSAVADAAGPVTCSVEQRP